jgi:hypothetical protein
MALNYTKMAISIPNGQAKHPNLSSPSLPKCTKIGIFWFENKPSGNRDRQVCIDTKRNQHYTKNEEMGI